MYELLIQVASDRRTPAAGSAAAAAAELATALVVKSARRSREVWPEAGGAIAQANALAIRLRGISATIESTYEDAMNALEAHDDDDIARLLPPAARGCARPGPDVRRRRRTGRRDRATAAIRRTTRTSPWRR